MNPFARAASIIGIERLGRAVFVAVLALGVIAAAVALAAMDLRSTSWTNGVDSLGTSIGAQDSDADGLPDALEARVGSDPEAAATLGGGVSDGWLHHWYGSGVDWNDTTFLDVPVLVPPRDDLPPALKGRITLPTLTELYEFEVVQRGGSTGWWQQGALDPREWDNNGDGLADGWLVMNGLDPLATGPDRRAPGDPSLTIERKYTLNLDPNTIDSDGDGLADSAELAGEAVIAGAQVEFEPTDPAQWSSRRDAIADGFLARLGLDTADDAIASKVLLPDGLSVAEAFTATDAHCSGASDGPCDWEARLAAGPLLDPSTWDSNDDGAPDAWAYRDVHGVADPFVDAGSIDLYSTEDWDADTWDGGQDLEGVVVDDANPLPTPLSTTILDHYRFLRPSSWDESAMGPWWDGLPTVIEAPDGALPPAVGMRGWDLTIDTGLGRDGTEEPADEDLLTIRVSADPRSADTDGDGITDLDEYFGAAGGIRTAPDNPDTDGDGLSDPLEAAHATNPLRRDSSGSLLTDGQEYTYWKGQAENASIALAQGVAPNGQDYSWLTQANVAPGQLAPLGSILPGAPANILNADVDQDGLKDGEELRPNTWLGSKDKPRSATNPARGDTDGDGLPDAWEVEWSADIYWACPFPCASPVPVDKWPIDPTLAKSIDVPGADSDYDISLAHGEPVRTAPGANGAPDASRAKTNGIAHAYDLHPFLADTDADGITDMFAIHWGVENVPDWPSIQAAGWPGQEAAAVAALLDQREYREDFRPSLVVIPPQSAGGQIGLDSNILGIFSGQEGAVRAKGTWIYVPGPCTSANGVDRLDGGLPTSGLRRETSYSLGTGADAIPPRDAAGSPGALDACWEWHEHNLAHDVEHRTNPWSHDFDQDGLPDAWEAFHGNDMAGEELTPGSLEAGCDNQALHVGLPPRANHCITHREAYQRGLDPAAADTDAGGLADWIEIALDLHPLNPDDDHGEEDWDGDGLPNSVEDEAGTNRLNPDTDGDGLLDGDGIGLENLPFHDASAGDGNLCARPGADEIAPEDGRGGTEHRPGGPLTHSQRLDMLIEAGIVFVDAANIVAAQCGDVPSGPAGESHILLLREGTRIQPEWGLGTGRTWIGAGGGQSGGSSSTDWDSSGDGIPDGWMVHWRNQASDSSQVQIGLDPLSRYDSRFPDPDQDLVPTLDEYRYGRPSDWREAEHGTWWGGLDPTGADTDADGPWYANSFDALDDRDPDQDNDGIWDEEDAEPSLDAGDGGVISWAPEGYSTDFTLLWDRLAQRAGATMPDEDGDSVPDFLDRARVRIDDLAADATTLGKGAGMIIVTGTLVIDEPEPADINGYDDLAGADGVHAHDQGVAGATIRVLLADDAMEALVGFGVTQDDGSFEIPIRAAASTLPAGLDEGTSVAGRLLQGQASLVSQSLLLAPGHVDLIVVAEANQPLRQPINAAGQAVIAYKDLDAGFKVPTNRHTHPMQAGVRALLRDGGGEADPTVKQLMHATNAIFPTRATHASQLILTADANLQLDLPEGRLRTGDAVTASGTLLDDDSVGIAGQSVSVSVHRGAEAIFSSTSAATNGDGSFSIPLPSHDWTPGAYSVVAEATLTGDAGQFLAAPEPVTKPLVLAEDSSWEFPVSISGTPAIADGILVHVDATEELVVEARLKDHRGQYLDGRDVDVTLRSLDGVIATTTGTVDDGWLDHDAIPALDPATVGLGDIRLIVEAHEITSGDLPGAFELSLRPRFATTITLEDASTDVGEPADIKGVLQRTSPDGPVPVASIDTQGSLTAVSSTGTTVAIASTDAQGAFNVEDLQTQPIAMEWTATFTPPTDCSAPVAPACYLAPSSSDAATAMHIGQPVFELDPPTGIRGQSVEVTGSLLLPSGDAVAPQAVVAVWLDDLDSPATATTRQDGTFTATLPARDSSGIHAFKLAFAGQSTLEATEATADATIQIPMAIEAEIDGLLTGPSDAGTYIVATLHDGTTTPFQGKSIEVTISQANDVFQTQLVTNTSSSISVSTTDNIPPRPGAWEVRLHYSGTAMETPAWANQTLDVQHAVETRLDAVPLHLAPGRPSEIRGHMVATSSQLAPLRLALVLDGTTVAHQDVKADGPWRMVFMAPHVEPGNRTLEIVGTGADGVLVGGAEFTVLVHDAVSITLDETVQPNGARTVSIQAEHATKPAPGLHVTITRRDASGTVVGVHPATTDDAGQAMLHLDATETGTLEVARIDDGLRLAGVKHEAHVLPLPPIPAPLWPWVAGAALVAGATIGATFLVWKANRRRMALHAFADARKRLLDPESEPGEIVREAYRQLLHVLSGAGYIPGEQETVRDIADRATRALRLPPAPMTSLAHLFELAVYSEAPLDEGHRATAVDAFESIAAGLEDPS